MNVEELKRIIITQKEEIDETFTREKIIDRMTPTDHLLQLLSHPNILAILGARRAGKSIFSTLLLKGKKYGYLNFDDERLVDFKPEKLDLVLQGFYELYGSDIDYVILDEIQNVESWELFANRLRRTKKVILTGSNSKLLSGELATHLTGRYSDFTLYPFSFQEFLALKGKTPPREALYSTKKISELKNLVRDYISLGGFPEVHKFGKSILLKTYEDIIQRDILLRYRIKNKTTFKELSKY
ncbi:MAG: ATP-binding protein, partial [Candidatus Thermoplasmatota archaeon]